MMPISDPRDRFFYSHHTPMKDTYYIYFVVSSSDNIAEILMERANFHQFRKKKNVNELHNCFRCF